MLDCNATGAKPSKLQRIRLFRKFWRFFQTNTLDMHQYNISYHFGLIHFRSGYWNKSNFRPDVQKHYFCVWILIFELIRSTIRLIRHKMQLNTKMLGDMLFRRRWGQWDLDRLSTKYFGIFWAWSAQLQCFESTDEQALSNVTSSSFQVMASHITDRFCVTVSVSVSWSYFRLNKITLFHDYNQRWIRGPWPKGGP